MMRPEHLAGRRNVAHLAWEQKDANPWWKVVYDRYDEIWTISAFAATAFRTMFPGRVRVVPNVLNFDEFPFDEEVSRARLRNERIKFLFVFEANSSMERKNPEGVIDAFVKAFKDTHHAKRVQLTLKVGSLHRPEHAARVERLMRKASESGLAIDFDGRQLARNALLRLIAEADAEAAHIRELARAEGHAEGVAFGREAGLGQHVAELDAGPLADGAPAFIAIVHGDLGARRQSLDLVKRKGERPAHQPIDRQPPIGELRDHHLEIGEAGRHGGAVERKIRRNVRDRELPRKRLCGQQQALNAQRNPLAEIKRAAQ